MAVTREASRMGIDLSGPVRAVLVSKASGQVMASLTAQTEFDQDSKESLAALAREIKEFWKPYRVRPDGFASVPDSSCLLFTVPMQPLSQKEFKQAMHLQIERQLPGGSSTMRMSVKEWPARLPLPPASGGFEDNKTYLVAAAESTVVLAAKRLMKLSGVRQTGVEIPAMAGCRGSRWLWSKHVEDYEEDGEPLKVGETARVQLNMALVVEPNEAFLYLAFSKSPWLKREIPLDPDNPFINAQIIAGEISRSARFAASSLPEGFTTEVTIMGTSDSAAFLADYLGEQTGIKALVWGAPYVESTPEYGVAAGLALPKEGVF